MLVLWEPMLGGDSRARIDRKLFDDPRVVTFWDPRKLSGAWFGKRTIAGLGGDGWVVWDAFYAFGPSARWDAAPTGALAAGSDIIGNVDALSRSFVPLLGGQ